MSGKAISDVSTAAARGSRGAGQAARVVPALTIVSHPMPHRAGERLLLDGLAAGREVALSRNAPEFLRPRSSFGAPLVDPFISRKPVRLAPAPGGAVRVSSGDVGGVVIAGQRVNGAVEIGGPEIAAGVTIELGGRVLLLLHLALAEESPADLLGMVGESAGIHRVRQAVSQVVDLDVPVLIRGETGTGKELVARAVHERSGRRGAPFVAVNLGAIPRDLAAAELFGAHKGAYTGATRDREGFFRAADGGTLFLDEVGEASAEVQVLLLRVLETGKLYPVGSSSPVAVDVRLIAATDANLEERIQQGAFKAPLLHRLSGYEIKIPPLRERREDIGALFCSFAQQELSAIGEAARLTPTDPYVEPWLPPVLAARLIQYAWPGNVRQLRNVTRQLVIGSRGRPCLQIDLPIMGALDAAAAPPDAAELAPEPDQAPARRRKSTEVTEQELITALRESAWDVKAAADRLGVPRSSIYDLMERSPNIRTARDLRADEITRCFRDCGGDLDAMARRLEVSKRALGRRVKELALVG
jgi:two-component system, NtrC family, nitrogen regulation response regulator GlnG